MWPEQLCTLTFWFSDNPYSFKPCTIESPRIISFLLGLLFLSALILLTFCGGSVSLMVCRTVSRNFYCWFSSYCAFCSWFSERYFTVFTLLLLKGMLTISISIFICLLCSPCNKKRSYAFKQYDFLIKRISMTSLVIIVSSLTFICYLFYMRKFLFYEVQFLTNENLEAGEFFV